MPDPVVQPEVKARSADKVPLHWFLRPYVQMFISIGLSITAQILLKRGAEDTVAPDSWFGIAGLKSPWVWLGITALIVGLFSWLYALRFVPLNIAFNVSGGLTNVLVPLSGWLFFEEKLGLERGLGIVLVLIGVFIVAKPAAAVEEKL
jgi:multidrug transporter EmrE-like cation transporter